MKLKMKNKAVKVIKDYYLTAHAIRIDYYEKIHIQHFESHLNQTRIIFNNILGKL